jgi:hypothetical protein
MEKWSPTPLLLTWFASCRTIRKFLHPTFANPVDLNPAINGSKNSNAPTSYPRRFVTSKIPPARYLLLATATKKKRRPVKPPRQPKARNRKPKARSRKPEAGRYFPAVAPVAAGIMPAIFIPSIRASTFSTLAPVSVHASTYGCRPPSACITSTPVSACVFFAIYGR